MAQSQLSTVLKQLRSLAGADAHAESARTDGQLLDCFVNNGDEDAFASLMERHGAMVFGVCRRVLNDPTDAEDAFQAAFLVLARRAASIRRHDSLAGCGALHTASPSMRAPALAGVRTAKGRLSPWRSKKWSAPWNRKSFD